MCLIIYFEKQSYEHTYGKSELNYGGKNFFEFFYLGL